MGHIYLAIVIKGKVKYRFQNNVAVSHLKKIIPKTFWDQATAVHEYRFARRNLAPFFYLITKQCCDIIFMF
jgi:hypothetical protein